MLGQEQVIVSGTGHRPKELGGYSLEARLALQKVIIPCLEIHKVTDIWFGAALGFDQALAYSGLELNIRIHAAIPFEGQENMWPVTARISYKALLDKCTTVHIVTKGGAANWKFQKRNEFMVDKVANSHKNFLLTMFNGETEGGTSNCIDYAVRTYPTMKIVNLYHQWKNLNH